MILSSGQAKATKHVIFEAPPGGAWLSVGFFRNTHTSAVTWNLYFKSKASSISVGAGVPKDVNFLPGQAVTHPFGENGVELGEGDKVEIDASVADKFDYCLFGRKLMAQQQLPTPIFQVQPGAQWTTR